jgi:hypothetical protein
MGAPIAPPAKAAPAPAYADLIAQRDELLKAEPTPEVQAQLDAIATQLAGRTEGQGGLNLEGARTAADVTQERERLKRMPQTPEVKARIKELDDHLLTFNLNELEAIKADKETETAAAEQEAKARKKFPGLAGAPDLMAASDVVKARTQGELFPAEELGGEFAGPQVPPKGLPAAAPTLAEKKPLQYKLPLRTVLEGRNPNRDLTIPARPGEITLQNLQDTGVPMRTSKTWLEQNVVGKTQQEVQRLVDKDPTLTEGTGQRAKMLRELLAQQPAKFEETPSVTTPTAPTAVEQGDQPRGGEPSLGVPSEPAAPIVSQPAPGTPRATGAPAAPVGRGLVPTGRIAGEGNAPQGIQPAAVAQETPQEEAARKAEAEAVRKALEAPTTRPAPNAAAPAAKKAAPKAAPVERMFTEDMGNPFDAITKYKELKAKAEGRESVSTTAKGQSVDTLKASVQSLKGPLGHALRRMVASGKIKLEAKHPSGRPIGGYYDGSTVTLYADGIPEGKMFPVALHEVGAHLGMSKMLGKDLYSQVGQRIMDLVEAKDGSFGATIAQAAYKRIPIRDMKRGPEVFQDELIAYFVEEMAKADAAGTLPQAGPMRTLWSRIRAALTATVNKVFGVKLSPTELTPENIYAMAQAAFVEEGKTGPVKGEVKEQFSVSFSTDSVIDLMGPLDAQDKSGLRKLIDGVKANPDVDYVTKFRTQTADIAATIEQRLRTQFDGAVRDSLGKVNPMGLYRQAQDYSKMLLEYFQTGTLSKDPVTGLWKSGMGKGVRPPAEVYALIDKYAAKNGYTREHATQKASRVLEGVRLDGMRASNKTGATNFKLHLNDSGIDQLVREYKADPALQEMSKLMDEARIAMVDNLVKVGRLTKEMGDEWKSVVGYVPFDRIEDFATKYSSAKKISTKGLSQLGKLPELIGSDVRPVGNVFDNYINTLGWMVGQTLKTDATVQTLRSLEDIGQAKYLGRSAQAKPNTVGAYIDGEMMYWELPSKYDLMAFKDLTPPKAGWLRALGEFSNVLRKSVTVLPPFALKQVTDDVQRAILTSGVKNPGALIRMSLSNFGGMALAELRGIQHPSVKEFGALGLTGEYDFQAGKPAMSLLKDLGYKKRGKFENILHRLDGITRASDLAVRKAIYDQTLTEGGDTLLAQTRAREFINFRRRGGSDFVGAMVTTIPFFNAYIQGMDVLYRAASGKDSSSSVDRAQARRMFWSRAGTAFMLSSLYALGKGDDDEDYNEMDLRTRDSNWILPGGYKIPVPGELGALFKVIPERIVEYMRRQGTPEEQTAFEAMRTTLSYMYEQYLGRVNPVPQAIKPVLEAWANKSFLTGRALEGYHHQAMDPSMRVTEQTSELAKAIAAFSRDTIGVETSPIMIDNALRGYFGSSAAMFTMVTDSLLNPTRVDRPLHKYALLSNYLYDPVGTRRMTEFYEEREKVGKANTTLNELMKTDLGRAEQYANDHQDELALESAINSTLNQLENTRAYRKFLNSSEGAKEMSTDEREAALKEVKSMELEYVKWVREAQTELRNAQR